MKSRKTRKSWKLLLAVMSIVFAFAFAPALAFAQNDAFTAAGFNDLEVAPAAELTAQDDQTVYVAKSSKNKIYHFTPTCSGMRSPRSMSLSQAQASGYRPCQNCASGSTATNGSSGSNAPAAPAAQPPKAYAPLPKGDGIMYRLYNPNSYEHFFTADPDECDNVRHAGWTYEGVGWTAPATGDPVYRLYNPNNGGDHHYTMNPDERDTLVAAGWIYEKIGWYSAPADDEASEPIYREYNPNELARNHNYTKVRTEHDHLLSLGWRDELIAWYGV